MPQNTSTSVRGKRSLREELLDAAAELLSGHGFHGLRMADVAMAAQVSRQTVYNEFGNKEALVEAVAIRTTAEFLDGIDERMRASQNFLDGFRSTVVFTLEHAGHNRLVASVLGTSEAEDLLPLLTTRGAPVLHPSIELFTTHLHERFPGMPEYRVSLIAESAVRLVLSHLVLPTACIDDTAKTLGDLIAPLLDPYQEAQP
ncbi:MAG: TetR/AcrR family transcriptional regulator [Sciscionella sp.]